jgi:hypothetical protein
VVITGRVREGRITLPIRLQRHPVLESKPWLTLTLIVSLEAIFLSAPSGARAPVTPVPVAMWDVVDLGCDHDPY